MNYIKLGERIRQERIKRNLTQAKIAEVADISTSYMGQIERGEKSLTLDTLIRIANNLDVSIDYLLRDSLTTYSLDDDEEWNRLAQGKTGDEKRKLIEVIKAVEGYKGG